MVEPRADPNGYFLGRELAPTGFEWEFSPPSLRLRYWKQVGELAAKAKDAELAAGLDRQGRPLIPIAQSTRVRRLDPNYSPMGIADPDAPPLTPVYDASRTRSLLRWKAYQDGVAFYWAYDGHTGDSWGVILGYHRQGVHGRVRDVIGLSPNAIRRVKRQALAWWEATLAKIPAKVRKPEPAYAPKYERKPAKKAPIAPYVTEWGVSGIGPGHTPIDFAPIAITTIAGVGVKGGGR
jgi:hypothetical protein